jgi:NADH-quinone oxidoreductase subunit J
MILGPVIQIAAFALFAFIAIAGALGMTTTMSMFRSGIFLMGSFMGVAGLFIMLSADLLGLLQVMMYIGGMLVMILFMVLFMHDPGGAMMAGMDMSLIEKLFSRGIPPMEMDHGGMNHSQMPHDGGHEHMQHGDGGHEQMQHGDDQQMDHSQMPHDGDHEQMQHGDGGHEQMNHSQMPHDGGHEHMQHGDDGHEQMQHGDMPHDGGHEQMQHDGDHEHMQYGDGGHEQMQHGDMGGMDMDMSMTTPLKRPAAVLATVTGALLVALLVLRPAWPASAAAPNPNSAEQVGQLLMGKYMMAFEAAGLLILIGIFGAVFLARPGAFPDRSDRDARVAHDDTPAEAGDAPLEPLVPEEQPDEGEEESAVNAHHAHN